MKIISVNACTTGYVLVYTLSMPQSSQMEDVPKEDGSMVKKLHIEFTNGSLQQLEDLGQHFGINGGPSEVVQMAISFLQNIKDKQTTKESPKDK